MRSTKELLELLLERYEKGLVNWNETLRKGICRAVAFSEFDEEKYWIARNERYMLSQYFEVHLPRGSLSYSWPKGELEPRIEWLKLHAYWCDCPEALALIKQGVTPRKPFEGHAS